MEDTDDSAKYIFGMHTKDLARICIGRKLFFVFRGFGDTVKYWRQSAALNCPYM